MRSHLLAILNSLKKYAGTRLLSLEISEINPLRDINHKTEKAIFEIIKEIF